MELNLGLFSPIIKSNLNILSLIDPLPAHSPEGQSKRDTTLVRPTIGVSFAMKVATSKPFIL